MSIFNLINGTQMPLIVKINYDYNFSYLEYKNLFFNLKNHK